MVSPTNIHWIILAGGRASRMGGSDKGLIPLNGEPLISFVFNQLKTQAHTISISANRHQDEYQRFAPTFNDDIDGFAGPLAGILAGLKHAQDTEWVGFIPCDSPLISSTMIERLCQGSNQNEENEISDIVTAHDGKRLQPLFSIWHRDNQAALEQFLMQGERKVTTFLDQRKTGLVDFSDVAKSFINLNTPEELTKFAKQAAFALK
ncbi:molybdenum cofactor guanylyltransferase MobA [Vibrio profundum]|uniref:molybdenum cofactor guanylyltransferase MobA n=1 Tax=Vibrio profundum TaxID=2910247 RepID=UPI003D0A4314